MKSILFNENGKWRAKENKMGKNVVIIGTQWGDEGKGKIVDLITDKASSVVRFQGGHNAGHTLVIDGKKTVSTPHTIWNSEK